MQRKPDDHKDHEQLRGCFYRGRVRTDDRSAVAVSLCDGMVSDKPFMLFVFQSPVFGGISSINVTKTRAFPFQKLLIETNNFNYCDL